MICRSRSERNPCLIFLAPGGSGHGRGLPAGREQDVSEANLDVHWNKWAAMHECAELKETVCL